MRENVLAPLAPQAVASRYDVGEVLASGGMGSVHAAFDSVAQRPVAYKRLSAAKESARSRMAALFQREYDTLRQLTHPNIVEVYDYGFDASGPYYTMELLSGSDLAKLAPLSVRDACRVLRDVASALALLHTRRLVHRDVSPNNVRLTADGQAKLIDFGGLTEFGVPTDIVGTPAFLAPECLAGAALDQRADLYALGALAYWTLTRRLHVRTNGLEDLEEAWKEAVPPPSYFVPDVPKELDELVLALLQHDPVARPRTAADVIERLTTIAALPPEQDEPRVASSYLQHLPLRGRELPMAFLVRAMRAALAGDGQVVLLEAEQGLGRSALLHQLAVQAQLAGATVLQAQGGLHTTPFSAARHLVNTGMRVFPGLLQRERSSQHLRLAGRDPNAGPRSTIDASEQHAQVASLLQDELQQLSLRAPLVLLIDDAHTIDAESLALFASLVESLRNYPILMVLSMRSNQAAQHLDAQAKIEASAQRCTLNALGDQHLSELVATMFGGVQNSHHLASWLYRQTGGNPGNSVDLARLLLTQGAIRYTVGTFTLPHEFAAELTVGLHGAAALANLADLSERARDLAYLLGVHTGPLTSEQLATASGLNPRDLVLALEQLVQRGAAVLSDDSISSASEALRYALCGSRSETDKRAAHLALARALRSDSADSLACTIAGASHLLSAGGEEAQQGASLLASIDDQYRLELAASRPALALLEHALAVLDARRVPESECLGLLIPLSHAGFYGQLELQQRYLPRTMRALSDVCGVTLGQRLRRFFGAKLGLTLGLLVAFVVYTCTRRSLNRRTFVQLFSSFGGIPGTACAASACAWDVPETYRAARWLDPFAAAGERNAMSLMLDFCMATSELVSVKQHAAAAHYTTLLHGDHSKVVGLDEVGLEQLRCGCIHGKAQALVTDALPEALVLADELQRRSAFFAPHAEGIRMAYHLNRGEVHKALPYRERAEALALRGGTSWSATAVMTIRMMQGLVAVGDVVGLVHVVAELGRLAKLGPSVEAIHTLAQAHLELLRGHPELALPVYERVLDSDIGRSLPTYPLERALHAQALSSLGQHEAAPTMCLAILDEVATTQRDSDQIVIMPRVQLARAEGALGNIARAVELLEECFERIKHRDNPLLVGLVHGERARLAALAGDGAAFERHLAVMSEQFLATENPWLIQQCDAVRAEGVRLGLRAGATPVARPTDDLDGHTELETTHDRAQVNEPATSATRLRAH